MKKILKYKDDLLSFAGGIGERKLTVYAASGCYYLFMSMVPFIMIVCCILPYTPLSRDVVMNYVNIYLSSQLAQIVQQIVSAVYRSNGATLTVSILLTLYSASASMRALMAGMDAAYNFKKRNNFLIYNARALLHMLLLLVTLLLSLLGMVYGGKILHLIRQYLPHLTIFNYILSGSRFLMIVLLLAAAFTLLFKLMPSSRVPLLKQLPGAIFTAVVWMIFSYVFNIYINISNKFGAYGFIGTIMVAMMWMYYCLLFLLIGGYLNSYLMGRADGKGGEQA